MKKSVNYKYHNNIENKNIEKLCSKVILLIDKIYSLPDTINIEFRDLGDSTYGMTMLDPRYHNTIRLNCKLSYNEVVIPLCHELLHIHQMHTGSLRVGKKGVIIYNNVNYKVDYNSLDYNSYTELPWEQEVIDWQRKLLIFIEKNVTKNA